MKGAYQSGNDFVMFIQAEDTEFVQMTNSGDWVVSDNAGALGGKTLECKKKASGITGREAGAMLDEIVISSYSIAQYDPNFYEGNTNTISVCKFCGTDVHHYVADPFAKLGKSAEEYFTTVLHTDATAWKTDLEITFDEEGPGKNDGDNGNNNNGSKPSGSDKTPERARSRLLPRRPIQRLRPRRGRRRDANLLLKPAELFFSACWEPPQPWRRAHVGVRPDVAGNKNISKESKRRLHEIMQAPAETPYV